MNRGWANFCMHCGQGTPRIPCALSQPTPKTLKISQNLTLNSENSLQGREVCISSSGGAEDAILVLT